MTLGNTKNTKIFSWPKSYIESVSTSRTNLGYAQKNNGPWDEKNKRGWKALGTILLSINVKMRACHSNPRKQTQALPG